MSSFFPAVKTAFLPLDVGHIIQNLQSINRLTLKIDLLNLEITNFELDKITLEKESLALLADKAGIQSEIESFSKPTQGNLSFQLDVLGNVIVSRKRQLTELERVDAYKKGLSSINTVLSHVIKALSDKSCTPKTLSIMLEHMSWKFTTLQKKLGEENLNKQVIFFNGKAERLKNPIGDIEEVKREISKELQLKLIELQSAQKKIIIHRSEKKGKLKKSEWLIQYAQIQLLDQEYIRLELLHNLKKKITFCNTILEENHGYICDLSKCIEEKKEELRSLIQRREEKIVKVYSYKNMEVPSQMGMVKNFVNYNQAIYIQDIILNTDKPSQLLSEQLIEKIEICFNTAHKYHKNVMDGSEIKKGYENHVTRLITNEFSFYTKDPLSLDEYQYIVEIIENFASCMPPNIHLILSSFSVKDSEERLVNVALHVTTGKEVVIHHGVKSNPFDGDPSYGLVRLDSKIHDDIPKTSMMKKVSSSSKVEFSFSHLIQVKTLGEARFITSLDICLDAKYGCSRESLVEALESKGKNRTLDLILQHSHIISSHVIKINSLSILRKAVQADKDYYGRWHHDDESDFTRQSSVAYPQGNKKLPNENSVSIYHLPFTTVGLIPSKPLNMIRKLVEGLFEEKQKTCSNRIICSL